MESSGERFDVFAWKLRVSHASHSPQDRQWQAYCWYETDVDYLLLSCYHGKKLPVHLLVTCFLGTLIPATALQNLERFLSQENRVVNTQMGSGAIEARSAAGFLSTPDFPPSLSGSGDSIHGNSMTLHNLKSSTSLTLPHAASTPVFAAQATVATPTPLSNAHPENVIPPQDQYLSMPTFF